MTMNKIPTSKLAGYTWLPENIEDVTLSPDYIAIEEERPEATLGGVFIPHQPAVTVGRVIAMGALSVSRGLMIGDRVVYEKWMGGRWDFNGRRCLIMDTEHIIMKMDD